MNECLSDVVMRAERHMGASQMDGKGKSEGSVRRQNLVQGTESTSLWLEKRALGQGRAGYGYRCMGYLSPEQQKLIGGL